MKFVTLSHVIAIFRGGPAKLRALNARHQETNGQTNAPNDGAARAGDSEDATRMSAEDKGKGKQGAVPAPPTPAATTATPEPKRSKKQRRAVSDPGSPPSPAASTSKASLTRPSSPSTPTAIVSSSGTSPQTHPCLLPPAPAAPAPAASASTAADPSVEQPQGGIDRRAIMEQRDEFICDPNGGVNAQRLLALTRREMLEKAASIGAHALVDEQWSVNIIRPKRLAIGRAARTRVVITYAAVAARSTHGSDPHIPVALSQAKGLPGLMTVVERV